MRNIRKKALTPTRVQILHAQPQILQCMLFAGKTRQRSDCSRRSLRHQIGDGSRVKQVIFFRPYGPMCASVGYGTMTTESSINTCE